MDTGLKANFYVVNPMAVPANFTVCGAFGGLASVREGQERTSNDLRRFPSNQWSSKMITEAEINNQRLVLVLA